MFTLYIVFSLLLKNIVINNFQVEAFYDYSLSELSTTPSDSLCVILKEVTLKIDKEEPQKFLTCQDTVEEFLLERGIDIGNYAFDEGEITDGQHIVIKSATKVRRLVWQAVPFISEETYTTNLPHRKRVYSQKGQNGLRGIVIEKVTFPNGKSKEQVVEKWIEKEPISQVVTIGSKYPMQKVIIKGVTVYYWKKLTVVATSYDKNCLGCNDRTATGAKLTKGIVAVDPRVIPLHTRMYVPGYGFGKAEDVGGAVKGNKIDLAYEDLRYGDWSKRSVTIYIID